MGMGPPEKIDLTQECAVRPYYFILGRLSRLPCPLSPHPNPSPKGEGLE
jgi:hypothetical protein